MNYELDLEHSPINYITNTQRKYFKIALEHVLNNDEINAVVVNRTLYYFDFKKNEALIGSNVKDINRDLHLYKLRKIEK